MTAEWLVAPTDDGRELEVVVAGAGDGLLLFHLGTPTAASALAQVVEPATERGLRTVLYSRPGYAASTASPGRTVADAATDVRAVLRRLGSDRFVTVGWSGGGPHALACAALLPDSCAAAATLAGVAPHDAEGLDWLAGMGPENVAEFGAARAGVAALTSHLEAEAAGLAAVTGPDLVAALGGLITDVDKAALTGDLADGLAEVFRRSVSTGIAGWRDDDLAFVTPWGFDLSSITVPVAVWQGSQDRMVPAEHGSWLAAHLPSARAHLHDAHGHLSLLEHLPDVLDDLLQLAAWPLPAQARR